MAVAALDRVALGLDHVPLSAAKVVLLHRVQEPVLGRVAEYQDHPEEKYSSFKKATSVTDRKKRMGVRKDAKKR